MHASPHPRIAAAARAALAGVALAAVGGSALAGDLLRGGYSGNFQHSANPTSFTPPSLSKARTDAVDALARATRALEAVQAMQAGAGAIAAQAGRSNLGINPNNPSQTLPNVPDGLGIGALDPTSGVSAHPGGWTGVASLSQSKSPGGTLVTVKQISVDAELTWSSFNVGAKTTLYFDQSAGGNNSGDWIAFNVVSDPSGVPSQILGSIKAQGQVYVIDQSGIIFGGGSQVNVHALAVSSLPINPNLISRGLLNNPDDQFLFSQEAIPAGNNGPTPAFDPPAGPLAGGQDGDVIVQAGAQITAPQSPGGTGGRVELIGPDVSNAGTINTPDGQTILAAGDQVAFEAHPESDARLRGLDVYIGAVDPGAGTATNSGIIDVPRGDVIIAGKSVNQLGAVASTTSVTLNGQVDLEASYGAQVIPGQNNTALFAPTASGVVTLGPDSVTEILPELDSTQTVVGTSLALPSVVDIKGEAVHFAADSQLLAPNAQVSVAAGSWVPNGLLEPKFIPSSGQIYLDAGASIDVAGSIVSAPVSQNIVSAQLLGPQLADSPLQRNGALYGQTVEVDARASGVYDGIAWQGTPLANVSGFIALIQLPVGELTAAGGSVSLSAGGSVVMQPGSSIDVSGGAIQYQGGFVQTTDLISSGHIIPIAGATPDLVYQGILGSFTVDHVKWGVEQTYTTPLLGGPVYQESYVEGGNGGSISVSAPSVALDGELIGRTSPGPRQLQTPPAASSFSLAFQQQSEATNSLSSPTPPHVYFEGNPGQAAAAPFALDASGSPLPLSAARQAEVFLSPSLLTDAGFGSISVNNGDGDVTVPAGVSLTAPAWGSITIEAANLSILGSISAPDGTLSFTVYDYSPYAWLNYSPQDPIPPADPTRGLFTLGSAASLSTAGLVVDDRFSATVADTAPLATAGGSISISAFSADLEPGSSINVSGGLAISPVGKLAFGNAGSISIAAGQDPESKATLGGRLLLGSALSGFSGADGGALSILAPSVQIGGGSPADASTLLLEPGFFSSGGFTSFSITGLGKALGDPTVNDLPGILIAPGTTLDPVAESWLASVNSAAGPVLTPILLPQAQREPVSLSFSAPGIVNSGGQVLVRGDVVLGAGASITTDPQASVSISGNTVAILGSINAPAGSISIKGDSDSNLLFQSGNASEPLTTVYLGPQASLSAAGIPLITPNVLGQPAGSILGGGSISLSGNIVAAAGSTLNVSGASGILYLLPAQASITTAQAGPPFGDGLVPVRVDSNGGSITLSGGQELFSDAALIGQPGGPNATGGSLTISSGRYYMEGVSDTPSPTDPTLVVTQSGRTIPGSAGIGQPVLFHGSLLSPNGEGHIAAASFLSGGFDSITLAGSVQFSGPVSISAAGALSVGNGGVIIADSSVTLAAPYVVLGLPFQPPLTAAEAANSPFSGLSNQNFLPTGGSGRLTVEASLIDIGNLSLQGISRTSLIAENGDIRGDGTLDVSGQLFLTAGQIYPATETTFRIAAYDQGSVTIDAAGSRALPLSAAGTLDVYASTIVQDGVLRAPLGSINLGWDASSGAAPVDPITGVSVDSAASVTLGSHSVTSVSAVDPSTGQALVIPFGLDPNGTAWLDPEGQNISTGGLPQKSVTIAAATIVDAPGSLIDISGGGDLAAYRFIAGEGGSTDFLNPGVPWVLSTSYTAGQLVTYGNSTWVALQSTPGGQAPAANQYWSRVPASYAVIPGYQASYAPYAPFNSATGDPGYVSPGLQTGGQIYIGPGSGLAAGIYTLLPARYALLPGAFLVTPETGTPAPAQELPTGSSLVSGYVFNGFSDPAGLSAPLISRFQVDSQAVVLSRGSYQTFRANADLSSAQGTAPSLPMDAGSLLFQAGGSIALQGEVDAGAPSGAAAGSVAISTPLDIYISNGAAGPAGALTLDAAVLDSFGAGTLLIGGLFDASGVDVQAGNIEVANSGAPLRGPDIILAANQSVSLDKGAVISAAGMFTGSTAPLAVRDSETLAAAGDSLTFAAGGIPISMPQGTPGNDTLTATVGGTITLSGGQSTTFAAGTPFTLGAGSSITLDGGGGTIEFHSGTGGPIPVQLGDGALLRVSASRAVSITRTGVASSKLPALNIASGASISGASAILDSTDTTSIGTGAVLLADAISVSSGHISIQLPGSGPLEPSPGLVLAGTLLQRLESAQSLTLHSYSSIDLYGAGSAGSANLGSLTLDAAGIIGFTSGSVAFQAKNIFLTGAAAGPVAGAINAGSSLSFDASSIFVGAGSLALDQFAAVQFNASSGILAQSSGDLSAQGDLAFAAPIVTGAAGSAESFSSGAALTVASVAGGSAPLSGGLGASLTLQGATVSVDGAIAAPSGSISIAATSGNLAIGDLAAASISAAGASRILVDQTKYAGGGSISLSSATGDVTIAPDATVSVAALQGGGNAGSLSISTPQGAATLQGHLLGSAGSSGQAGTFSLDAAHIPGSSLASLSSILASGGFTQSVSVRDRADSSLIVDGQVTAHSFNLSADSGSITVTGGIDAHGVTGGSIGLAAAGSIAIESGATLDVSAQSFDAAGQGGSMTLIAGAEVNGASSSSALVSIAPTSTIDLSVAAATPASAANGQFTGTLVIREPRAGLLADPQAAAVAGSVVGASAVIIQGSELYQPAGGQITSTLETQIYNDATAFLGSGGAANPAYTSLAAILSPDSSLPLFIEPAAEIINPAGSLTLGSPTSSSAADWDLSSFRFGPDGAPGALTLRASGDLVLYNALSDGFTSSADTATLLPLNPALPANIQSWSYTLAAGADFSAANAQAVLSGAGSLLLGRNDPNPIASKSGAAGTTASALKNFYQVIRTGAGSIAISAGANVELLNQFASIYSAGAAVADPTLGGSFGVPILDESKNPATLGAGSIFTPGYAAQYSDGGGDVSIHALQNIEHLTQDSSGNLIMDSEAELPDNWLYRRGDLASTGLFDSNPHIKFNPAGGGDPSESTTWWVDFSNFFEGVGALGGGNVSLIAGADIANVDAVIPTNARMPGIDPATDSNIAPQASSLVQLGGGNLLVQAGHDIDAGVYYVESGHGTLIAGDSIITNATRAPIGGISAASGGATASSLAWLPTTLFAGGAGSSFGASFDVTASSSILLGPVANPFLLPEGLANSIWYKTYFSTFAPSDAVNVTSLGGSITFREYAAASDISGPLLQVWLQNMDLMNPSVTSRAYYQPWLRINEDSVQLFSTVANMMPATLDATAFSGDIDIAGSLLLSPSPTGTINLAASGSIIGFQSLGKVQGSTDWAEAIINLSDSDPASVPGLASPLGYQSVPGVGTDSSQAGTSNGGVAGSTFLDAFSNLFDATAAGDPSSIQLQQALHASSLLHAADTAPAYLYAASGDITGLTFYSPKQARVIAGGAIDDVSFYLQNTASSSISILSAGLDFTPYDPASPARQPAQADGNSIVNTTPGGDITIAGPGTLEVLAGGSLDLGGQGPGGATNSTGDGISSIGNALNPALPFNGADLIAAAGIGAALGLDHSALDFSAFISSFVDSSSGALYLSQLPDIASGAVPGSPAAFDSLPYPRQDLLALDLFFLVLRDAGRDHNNPASPGFGNYAAAFAAIDSLFPASAPAAADIDVTSRNIKTESGGNITLLAPGGEITVGLNSSVGGDVSNLGIVTQDGGSISIFAGGSVNVGTSRIFTLHGGNEIIWSSHGNIDAGSSSKTVQSAPPTRVLVDPQSANVQTDLAGLATGGGIGVLASVQGVPPGNVDLVAPTGAVNAGEAGIRATGNLNIAAVVVLNSGNISVGGASAGLPPVVAGPSIGAISAASSAAGSAIGATTAQTIQPSTSSAAGSDTASVILVQVLGYGGPEDGPADDAPF